MKSSDIAQTVSKDASVLVSRAAAQLIEVLAREAMGDKSTRQELDYKAVADVVNSMSRYEFLMEMIPHKIKVKDYKALMAKQLGKVDKDETVEISSSSDSSTSSSSDSDSEDDAPAPAVAKNKEGGVVEIIEVSSSDDE